jgi:hypothetical protein
LEGDPQFWWVPDVLRKFPHPPDWEQHERHPDGRYKSFPPGISEGEGAEAATEQRLVKFASCLIRKDFTEEARKIVNLLRSTEDLGERFQQGEEGELAN